MLSQFKQMLSPRFFLSSCRKPYLVIGTVMLLSSFVSQQFLLSRFESRLKDSIDGTDLLARGEFAASQFVNLYYASRAAGADDSPELLQKASKQEKGGAFAFILSAPLEPHERDQWVQRLEQSAAAVDSLDSYNKYLVFLNSMQDELFPKRFEEQHQLRRAIEIAHWAYLAPYILGTLLLAVGFWRGE